MKKIIYNLIKYPLILILLKTPFINILIKRFKFHRVNKNNGIFWRTADTIFQREYYSKLKNFEKVRNLTDLTLSDGEGKKWAEHYYNNHFKTLNNLKELKVGKLPGNEALPIFEKIINFIEHENLGLNDNTYIVQLGSSSGRDIEFFLNLYPELKYISTDINDEILNFQKKKYQYGNLYFYKCYAEEIDKCIKYFSLQNKKVILFSSGSLQYVNPLFLKDFFEKIKILNNLDLFINEPLSLNFLKMKKKDSFYRGNTSYSHRYDKYVNNANLKLIEHFIIEPYFLSDKNHWDTCHSFSHVKFVK